MLGLRIALSVAKGVIDEIGGLLSKLARRSTYSENLADSRAIVSDIDSYNLLDKATILLTPTATSNARVHSVKTYTGDELVTNGTFDTDSDWTKGSGWSIVNGEAVHTGSGDYIEQGSLTEGNKYKVVIIVTQANGSGFPQIYMGGLTTAMTSPDTYTFYITAQSGDKIKLRGLNDCKVDSISVIDVSSDFDFDRASSATRINSDGLVQDMQSITDPELVLNGDFEELGDEEVTNGTFDADSNWSATNGATITGGVLNIDYNLGNGSTTQSNVFTIGKTYKIQLNVDDSSTGTARINSGVPATILSNGLNTFYIEATGTTLEIRNHVNFVGSIDNVSVKQVDPNDRWTLGTGWSIEDGVAVASNSSANATQETFTIDAAKTYKIDFTISDYGGGTFFITFGGNDNSSNFTANGSYTVYITPTNRVNNIFYLRASGFTGKIDNVSVKDITFSEDVDLARINYDSNGENGHWLLEPTSTNLLTYSEDFSQSNWTNSNISEEVSTVLSPNGETYSYKLTNDAVTGNHFLRDTITVSNGQTYTLSVFIKKGTKDIVSIADGYNVNILANFDLTNGTRTNVSATSSDIESYNNGWYKCSATLTTSSTNLGFMIFSGTTYAGKDESGYFYVWGAQAENLSYATSYIPTLTGSTVTRATETLTGSGNSTLINSTEGVLYAEIAALETTSSGSNFITITDGTYNNRASILFSGGATNQIRFFLTVGGALQVDKNQSVTNVKSFNKVAFKYKANDFAVWINGLEVATVTSGSVWTSGTINELTFSEIGTAVGAFRGKVKALAVFNEALSDSELTNLTS